MVGPFSTSHYAEITLKLPEIDVTAVISTPFHVTSKKSNYDVIFDTDFLLELGIQLNFQNSFIGLQDINIPMKPIDCKMIIHFTIQDSKNVRNVTNRIKKILDNNYKKANLKNIVNNLKYLNNDKQSLILKL